MKVTVQGQGQITLLQSDFVAAGGEGSIYCVCDRAAQGRRPARSTTCELNSGAFSPVLATIR